MIMPKESIPTNLKNYAGIIEEVKETDVLCGSKNTALGKHKGNLLLSARVRHHLDDYESASTRREKTFVNRSIINYMRQKYNARFLKQKPSGDWVEIEEQAIRDKVTHALRFASIRRKKDSEYQRKRSSVSALPVPSVVASNERSASPAPEDESFQQLFEAIRDSQQRILKEMMITKDEFELDRDALLSIWTANRGDAAKVQQYRPPLCYKSTPYQLCHIISING